MEDKYYLEDILECEKNMVVNLSISLNEASCDEIYQKYLKMFELVSKKAKDLFTIAYQNNWYQLENVDANKIKKDLKKMKTG